MRAGAGSPEKRMGARRDRAYVRRVFSAVHPLIDGFVQILAFLILAGKVLTLLHVVVEDLRRFRISNRSVLILLGLFALWSLLHRDGAAFLGHVLFGAVMFGLLLLMYRFRMMGGGDVKLLGVAFLWLGAQASAVFTVAMAASTLFYVIAAKLGLLPARPSDKGYRIPFGPSIATGWIITVFIVSPP
jgi:prepilin peptidase CpaA